MNQEKIGKFISVARKNKNLTQEELAEKLGVSKNAVSKWERGICLMDMSLLIPLSDLLDVKVNEILAGEKIEKSELQQKSEENVINTINYTSTKLKNNKKLISLIFIFFGLFIILIAFTIFPTTSSWGSIYSVVGLLISSIGVYFVLIEKSRYKRIILTIAYLILLLFSLLTLDYINVLLNKTAPRYSYLTETGDNIIIYNAPFYKVYRINYGTKNEYYIIDTKNEYTEESLPITPFNREISGIDNIIKYKNKYLGNNSNTGSLINSLPLSEYGYTFEIYPNNLGLTINYHITSWYINESNYLELSLIYNTISLFALIDNLENITYNFSGKTYNITKELVIENYPNYSEIIKNEIDKNNFNKYLESKLYDLEFMNDIWNKLFN